MLGKDVLAFFLVAYRVLTWSGHQLLVLAHKVVEPLGPAGAPDGSLTASDGRDGHYACRVDLDAWAVVTWARNILFDCEVCVV